MNSYAFSIFESISFFFTINYGCQDIRYHGPHVRTSYTNRELNKLNSEYKSLEMNLLSRKQFLRDQMSSNAFLFFFYLLDHLTNTIRWHTCVGMCIYMCILKAIYWLPVAQYSVVKYMFNLPFLRFIRGLSFICGCVLRAHAMEVIRSFVAVRSRNR